MDELLEELEPHELVGWRAARYIVPLEDGWRQAGVVAAAAHNDFERFLAMKAGKRQVDESRLRTYEDYIVRPKFIPRGGLAPDRRSIAAHQAAIAQRFSN